MSGRRSRRNRPNARAKSFKESVESASHQRVAAAYREGITALGTYSTKVRCSDPRRLKGSIDMDSALQNDAAFAQLNRWDYGIGYQPSADESELAVWVEVHSAHTSEVSVVIKKKNWLRDYLISECDDLWKLTCGQDRKVSQFFWVASNGVQISKTSPQARALASAGIPWPQNMLVLG